MSRGSTRRVHEEARPRGNVNDGVFNTLWVSEIGNPSATLTINMGSVPYEVCCVCLELTTYSHVFVFVHTYTQIHASFLYNNIRTYIYSRVICMYAYVYTVFTCVLCIGSFCTVSIWRTCTESFCIGEVHRWGKFVCAPPVLCRRLYALLQYDQ